MFFQKSYAVPSIWITCLMECDLLQLFDVKNGWCIIQAPVLYRKTSFTSKLSSCALFYSSSKHSRQQAMNERDSESKMERHMVTMWRSSYLKFKEKEWVKEAYSNLTVCFHDKSWWMACWLVNRGSLRTRAWTLSLSDESGELLLLLWESNPDPSTPTLW